MLLHFAVRRIARHWHLLLIPLLGACLAGGLFALAPLYSRAVSELGVRYAMETESHTRVHIRVSNPEPMDEAIARQAAALLGDLFSYRVDAAESALLNEYDPRRNPPAFSPDGWFFCNHSNLRQHATLVAGRWPEDRVPFFVPSVGGFRVDSGMESGGRLVVRRAVADLEAVSTAESLRALGIEYPNQLRIIHLGPGEFDLRVRIVGIFAANDANEAYWMGERKPLEGTMMSGPDGEPLFFGALHITTSAMQRVVNAIEQPLTVKDDLATLHGASYLASALRSWARRLSGSVTPEIADRVFAEAQKAGLLSGLNPVAVTYAWYLVLDRDALTASTMRESAQNVLRVGELTNSSIPGSQVISGLVSIIRVYLDQIRQVQGPVTLLTAGVLVLVLYYVLTSTSWVLEQQAAEWSTLSSRGSSSTQLLFVHGVTVLIQCVLAFVASLPIAHGLVHILRRVGPLARLAVGPTLPIEAPLETWNYAAVAALLSAAALLLPAIPAARRTIIAFQQAVARPPGKPVWARFGLDLALLAVGAGLLMRSKQLGNLQAATLTGKSTLDTMTVVAPLLVLTGTALLWLRLYPIIMGAMGALASRSRGLAYPLGLWHISRNPTNYAQLVLLLLGAFGLGAMSSTLSATREGAAWRQAQEDTGGTVRLELAEMADYDEHDWTTLDGVTAASPVFRGVNVNLRTPTTLTLLGIDGPTLAAVLPLEPAVEALAAWDVGTAGGILLPEHIDHITLWARHENDHSDARLALWLILEDRWGLVSRLEMQGDPLLKGQWTQWRVSLQRVSGRPPWRLVGLAFTSRRGTASLSSGQVYVDDLDAWTAGGTAIPLDDFESGRPQWSGPLEIDAYVKTTVEISAEGRSGSGALLLGYRTLETARYNVETFVAWADRLPVGVIPILLETRFARLMRLGIGDSFRLNVTLGAPNNIRGQLVFCELVGTLDTFATLGDSPNSFLIAPARLLLRAINHGAQGWPLEPNEVWLSTNSYQPSAMLSEQLAQPTLGVRAVHTAAGRREELRRDPLSNAFAGILFAGFWVALLLSLVGMSFYLALSVRRREVSFAVLRSLGWSSQEVWRLLVVEQVALAVPAVTVGIAVGIGLANIMRRFIPVVATAELQLAWLDMAVMITGLAAGLSLLLISAGYWVQKRELARVLRLGGE